MNGHESPQKKDHHHLRSPARRLGVAWLALALAGSGCLVPDELRDEGAAAAGIESVQGAVLAGETARLDRVSTVELNPGSWGTWGSPRYCPARSWAIGYRMRVEGWDAKDTSALNAIELQCMDPFGNVTTALAHEGLWGAWGPGVVCTDSYLTGGAVRYQPSRGNGDDTAANDFRVRCGTSKTPLQAAGGGTAGSWPTKDWATDSPNVGVCPAGTNVCGLSVRFEPYQGTDKDDTALNAVRLECCTNNEQPKMWPRVTDRVFDGANVRTFTPPIPVRATLLVVEGFDTDDSYTAHTLPTYMKGDFLGRLLNMGYAVAFVDLAGNNWRAIEQNADRLGNLAQDIWTKSIAAAQANPNQPMPLPLKFMGASMGGLIATTTSVMRYDWPAAAVPGRAKPTWTFQLDHITTLDSPQSGVYIPQAMYHLFSRFNALNVQAGKLYKALTSDAAMAMAYVPFDANTPTKPHDDWQSYYDKVLASVRRSDVRYVGVVDGSWIGKVQNAKWTKGFVNVSFSGSEGAVLDYDVWLHTQADPGNRIARIALDWLTIPVPGGNQDEDKSYPAYSNIIVENTAGGFTDHWDQVAKQRGTSATFKTHSFVQTWSAAGVPFKTWKDLPEAQKHNMAALEAARGPVVGSALSPFDRILKTDDNNAHPFIPNQAVGAAVVDELWNALIPPTYKAMWTPWSNRDTPAGGGDTELASASGVPCQQPLTAECRRVSDGVDWTRTGEVVSCTPSGLVCLAGSQSDGACDDYEVRFACPDPATLTPWLDRDDPTGNGDGEHLGLHVQDGQACVTPIGVECQTTGGLAWEATGEKLLCQPNRGSNCLNANQADGTCEDYRVRFVCPKPSTGFWTPWLDRDNPTGTGDGEALDLHVAAGNVCARPLAVECRRVSDAMDWSDLGQKMVCSPTQGAVCLNKDNPGGCQDYQVRFFCPSQYWPKP